MRYRGGQPRQKQNRLIFIAAESDALRSLNDQCKTFLAWSSIIEDVNDRKMDHLSMAYINEAKRSLDSADKSLEQMVSETYKWIVCPVEEFNKGKNVLKWESISVSPSATNFTFEIEMKLREEEWLVPEWSPIHLSQLLQKYYFKDNVEVSALKVFQDCAHYLYMPRLVNDHVFINAISQGIQNEDYFGFAAGKDGDNYLGFSFGNNTPIMLDDNCLLINKEAAVAYKQKTRNQDPGTILPGSDPILPGPNPEPIEPTTPSGGKPKRFYGTIDIDPITATMTFSNVVNEVLQNFTSKPGSKVTISVEIQAALEEGYDENLRRTVKENCNVLKFKNAEFED